MAEEWVTELEMLDILAKNETGNRRVSKHAWTAVELDAVRDLMTNDRSLAGQVFSAQYDSWTDRVALDATDYGRMRVVALVREMRSGGVLA